MVQIVRGIGKSKTTNCTKRGCPLSDIQPITGIQLSKQRIPYIKSIHNIQKAGSSLRNAKSRKPFRLLPATMKQLFMVQRIHCKFYGRPDYFHSGAAAADDTDWRKSRPFRADLLHSDHHRPRHAAGGHGPFRHVQRNGNPFGPAVQRNRPLRHHSAGNHSGFILPAGCGHVPSQSFRRIINGGAMSDILETAMLICFGCSWPLSLIKNFRARSAKNMSFGFIFFIMLGYSSGILAKLLARNISYVLIFYALNLAMAAANMAIYFFNRRIDKSKNMCYLHNKFNYFKPLKRR